MPEARTKHFALISYEDGAVITFPRGLPAFEHLKRFILLEQSATAPIVFLQSIDDADVCLPAAPLPAICPDYRLDLSVEDWTALEATPGEFADLACLAVVTIPETGPATANLLAPLVIHLARRRAVQAVRSDTEYSHRHPVMAQEGAACS
jgi:flagellar assembly factor FliW